MAGTFRLTFAKMTGQQISRGPFSSVRFEGQQICNGETGQAIAAHLAHGWGLDGEEYLRLDITGAVSVTWEGHGRAPGTTGHFSCVNGVAYVDRRILAFVDRERNDWYLIREGQHHAALMLEPA